MVSHRTVLLFYVFMDLMIGLTLKNQKCLMGTGSFCLQEAQPLGLKWIYAKLTICYGHQLMHADFQVLKIASRMKTCL